MLIPILFIISSAIAYFVGGEKWGHTLLRDIGCPMYIFGMAWFLFGWSWWYLLGFGICWGGLTIGDDVAGSKWYWSMHGFVVGLSMCVISIWWGLGLALLVAGLTYLVSKFLNKGGIDVWCRGLIYGSMPLILLKILPN